MDRAARIALAAAATAFALAALPARVRACDRDDQGHPPPAPVLYPVVPATVPAPVYPPGEHAYWHHGSEMRELRRQYRRLEMARDRFYATFHGNPWRRDRFEAWYAARHLELDRRRAELERWRGHERWNG